MRAEIVERLEMRDPEIVVAGFDRPEIRLEVDHYADAYGKQQGVLDRVLAEIGEGRGPGIVYSATRKGTEEIAEELTDRGLRARPYHAGLSKAEREDTQRAWMDDELDVVVATTAFGMGIDKPDTRFVDPRRARRLRRQLLPGDRPRRRDGDPPSPCWSTARRTSGCAASSPPGPRPRRSSSRSPGAGRRRGGRGIEEGVDVKDLREETGRGATRWPAT